MKTKNRTDNRKALPSFFGLPLVGAVVGIPVMLIWGVSQMAYTLESIHLGKHP